MLTWAEGYPALIVHGSLAAALFWGMGARMRTGSLLAFRAQALLFDSPPFARSARRSGNAFPWRRKDPTHHDDR